MTTLLKDSSFAFAQESREPAAFLDTFSVSGSAMVANSNSHKINASERLLSGIVGTYNAGNIGDGGGTGQHHQELLTEDPLTLQLALELSMVGCLNNTSANDGVSSPGAAPKRNIQQKFPTNLAQLKHQQQQRMQTTFTAADNPSEMNLLNTSLVGNTNSEERLKKSQNMTECVPVPSSEHVAEIVGRQGCKIKALRAKTNTYIKTPVRGEEPVFVVTGRKEDVAKAKREILSAADHFSLIRASRKPSLDSQLSLANSNSGSASVASGLTGVDGSSAGGNPGHILGGSNQITIQVRVPYRVVGLVVGPKGATIKHIQQETQTYIVTPSREKEPIFEVTGLPTNVQSARMQIESHIALRTGYLNTNGVPDRLCNMGSHTINSLSQILGGSGAEDNNAELLRTHKLNDCSLMINTAGVVEGSNELILARQTSTEDFSNFGTNFSGVNTDTQKHECILNAMLADPPNMTNVNDNDVNGGFAQHTNASVFAPPSAAICNLPLMPLNTVAGGVGSAVTGNNMMSSLVNNRSCSSASSTTSSKSANNCSANSSRPELTNIWKNLGEALDIDEGIGESPSIISSVQRLVGLKNGNQSSTSVSPTDSLLADHRALQQCPSSQQVQKNLFRLQQEKSHAPCLTCHKEDVGLALMPCGHNLFCLECINRICTTENGVCPVCGITISQHMRRMLS